MINQHLTAKDWLDNTHHVFEGDDLLLAHLDLVQGIRSSGLKTQGDADHWLSIFKARQASKWAMKTQTRYVSPAPKTANQLKTVTKVTSSTQADCKTAVEFPLCQCCSKPIHYQGWGRKPKYCDNSCKQKEYRERRKLENRLPSRLK